MLLYQILTQQKEKLTFLANSEENVSLITRQITELKKHHITTDKLKELQEEVKEPYLKLKIQDILTLYTSLESNIQNRWIDETDILTMLAEKISESKILRNAVIYIDEFSGFTPQEYAVITALMKVAKKMMITITTDTLLAEFEEENNLFALNKITAKKILECAKKTNRKVLPPIILSENKRLKKEELKYLEEALYQTKTQKYQKEEANINNAKFAYTIKTALPKEKDKFIYSASIGLCLDSLFGASSMFREEVRNEKLATGFTYYRDLTDDYLCICFLGESDHPDEFIKKVVDTFQKKEFTESDVNRIRKVWLSGEVMRMDSPRVVLRDMQDDWIEYDRVMPERCDTLRSISYEDARTNFENLSLEETATVILVPKK